MSIDDPKYERSSLGGIIVDSRRGSRDEIVPRLAFVSLLFRAGVSQFTATFRFRLVPIRSANTNKLKYNIFTTAPAGLNSVSADTLPRHPSQRSWKRRVPVQEATPVGNHSLSLCPTGSERTHPRLEDANPVADVDWGDRDDDQVDESRNEE